MRLPFGPAEFAEEFGAFFVMGAGGRGLCDFGGEDFYGVAEAFVEQFVFEHLFRVGGIGGGAPSREFFPSGFKCGDGFFIGLGLSESHSGLGAEGGDERGLLGVPFLF